MVNILMVCCMTSWLYLNTLSLFCIHSLISSNLSISYEKTTNSSNFFVGIISACSFSSSFKSEFT
jgi:ABC-type enterochelin transport system permease subunit